MGGCTHGVYGAALPGRWQTPGVGQIVIVGLMGAGKTTVGAALAKALGLPLRDSDAEIQRATGRTARMIADSDGIEALHTLERAHVLDALAGEPAVITAAASVIDDEAVRAALVAPHVTVVWLRVLPAVAAARGRVDDHRPSPEPLAVQAARRDPRFASVASIVVDADDAAPDAIVGSILARLDVVEVAAP